MKPLELLLTEKTKNKKQPNTQNLKRCVGYVRVSTEEQTQNPEGSIRNQEERIKQAIQFKNGNAEFGTLNHVFTDAALSGKDMNRPQLKQMLNRVAEGEIDLIIVSDLSRLSRSIRDFSQIWEFLQAHHCQLWSLRENFDTSTAAGEMMLFSIANFSQYERKQTAERVSANFHARASRGLHNGGTIPLGYEPDPEKRGHLRIKEDQAKVVKAAFFALLKEGSIAAAARSLNLDHIKIAPEMLGAGSQTRLPTFNVANLTYMLTNPAYIGIRRYRDKNGKSLEAKAAWPAIIEEDIFAMTQKTIDGSRKRKLDHESRYPYLFKGKVICTECGQLMQGKSAHGRVGKVTYYEHGSQTRRDACLPVEERTKKCTVYRISAKKLEEKVFAEIEKLLREPKLSKVLFEKMKKQKLKNSEPDLAETWKIQMEGLNRKTEGLLHRLAELPKHIPATVLYQELEKLEQEKAGIQNRMNEVLSKPSEQPIKPLDYEQFLVRMNRMLQNDTGVAMKKAIVNVLIHRIEIHSKGYHLYFYVGAGQIKTGEAIASPAISKDNLFLGSGSFLLKNGDPGRIRTYDQQLRKLLL